MIRKNIIYVTCRPAVLWPSVNEQIYCFQISAYTSRSAFSKIWPRGKIWLGTYFCKFGFTGTQAHQFIYVFSIAALGATRAEKTSCHTDLMTQNPKIFAPWLFSEKFCGLVF